MQQSVFISVFNQQSVFMLLLQVSLVLKSIFTSDTSYVIVKSDIGTVNCGNNGKSFSLPLNTIKVALVLVPCEDDLYLNF